MIGNTGCTLQEHVLPISFNYPWSFFHSSFTDDKEVAILYHGSLSYLVAVCSWYVVDLCLHPLIHMKMAGQKAIR